MHWFYKLEQGQYLRSFAVLSRLVEAAGLQILEQNTCPIRPGLPGLPVVARFSRIIAQWANP